MAKNQQNRRDSMVKTKIPHLSSTSSAEAIDLVPAVTEMPKRAHHRENPIDSMIKTKKCRLSSPAGMDKDAEIERLHNVTAQKNKSKERPSLSSTAEPYEMAKRAHGQDNPSHNMIKTKKPHLASTSTTEMDKDAEIERLRNVIAQNEKAERPRLSSTAEPDKDAEIRRLQNIIELKHKDAEIQRLGYLLARKKSHIVRLLDVAEDRNELEDIWYLKKHSRSSAPRTN